jgi:type IV pilus assembly protein PilY1
MTHLLGNRFKPKTFGRTVMRSGKVDLALRRLGRFAVATLAGVGMASALAQTVDLADRPLFSTNNVPGNLMLTMSVEWPTASTPAYLSTDAFATANTYLGYFDPKKCYQYNWNSADVSLSYFSPTAAVSGSGTCTSSTTSHRWSGAYLNWAAMQSLDIFRWTLTGGDRAVDGVSETILEKTRHSGQGGHNSIYPMKAVSSAIAQTVAPTINRGLRTRVHNMGTFVAFCVGNATNCDSPIGKDSDTAPTFTDYTGTGAFTLGTVYRMQMRVKVCVSGMLESNCKAYGTNSKPEGLMQEYAMQLRFGAFGYLNDDSITRDGGVLRAQIRSIGPQTPVPGSASVANANTEWSATTGQFNSNPDAAAATQTSTDATAAGYPVNVNNSGAINYVNKFGKLTTSAYKGFDPVSEMYYAATRYFRNQGNVPAYSSLAGAGSEANLAKWIDGFPVIRQWNDPMQYSCQKNFILGMGDVYAWMDKNLPGSTITNVENAGNWAAKTSEPTMPSEVSGDTAVNVTTATNMVGQLEGLSNLGTTLARDGGASERANSTFIAGLAYEAHTRDIRPETALPGMQTISTYWLDVRESQTYESKNQYWLAAKYGGFEIPSGFDPYATGNNTGTIPDSAWTQLGQTIGSDSRPNNYFVASDPAAMVAGLRAAFARISSENEAASTTAFSTTTAKVSRTGTASYATQYNPRNWTGDVEASEITFNQYGVPELATRWNAGALLDATAAGSRKIVTCCTSAGAALPFRATNLAGTLGSRTNYASFANVPGVTGTQTAANYVDYLRGVRTLETSYSGGQYRTRTSVLGDIVGSRANPVGKPQFPYADLFNPGYGAFKTLHADRKTVVYVGANDGMLHAFDGTLPVSGTCASGTCGSELFAFIPSFSYGSTNAIAAAQGLASLGNPNFSHRYLVDATAQNYDVDFFNTPGPTATAPDWRTMLIGGLGKGGRGYYALDVTKPDDWTSETAMAGKFLWEFTDSRMGNTFGEAIVVKTRKYGWTVIVPSGYNNSDGVGYLFLLNPRTGALLDTISTPEGSTAAPISMAHANAFVPSFREYVADAVYAGDMRGNLWRFDLTATSGTYPQATKLATLTDGASVPKAQPVTTRPLIEIDPTTNRRYVVVATGRLLADSDILSTDQQTLYVIADGKSGLGEFYPNTPLPTSITFPIGRNNLNNNSNPLTGIGSAPTQPMGWYLDLVVPTSGPSERVNTDMTANLGAVLAAVNLPNGQACQGGGTGRLLGLRLSDGRTVLVQENTTTNTTDLVASQAVSNVITNLSFLTVGGQTRAYYGTTATSSSPVQPLAADTKCGGAGGPFDCTNLDTGGAVVRRLNWREVQTAN